MDYKLSTNDSKKVFFASDHAGFELKNSLIGHAKYLGFEVEDKGDFTPDPKDDYPDFISLVAKEISLNPEDKGIVIGGSGQGEAIVANKFLHVRAALWYGGDINIVKLSREHNNTNVLALGARFVNVDDAKAAMELWLKTPFSNEPRHIRRLQEIEQLK